MTKKIQSQQFFATAAKGLEYLLAEELKSFGAENIKEKRAGVIFTGTLQTAYRACLWSRVASRILLPIKTFTANNPAELYQGVQTVKWYEHLAVDDTLAIDFTASESAITHSQFAAQKVKDAIVDQFRQKYGERPSVQLNQPSLQINVYLHRNEAIVSIDLSGESLHRRGYRKTSGEAPLKENLAAAILLRAGWQEIAKKGGALVDVMCGSGTLPIESALIAADIAPGLLRNYFGFLGWKKHQSNIWEELIQEAQQRREIGLKNISPIVGYDADPQAIRNAHEHINQAGLHGFIHLEKRDLSQLKLTEELKQHTGLVIANPPYGERLGELDNLQYLYANLGEQFKTIFHGWQAAIFTGNADLGKCLGLRANRKFILFNGTIRCTLLNFIVDEEWYLKSSVHHSQEYLDSDRTGLVRHSRESGNPEKERPISAKNINSNIFPDVPMSTNKNKLSEEISQGGIMFANRLRKNLKNLKSWLERENISCFRVYDADLPDYAVAIDRYDQFLHIQEYAPPKTIDPQKAQHRLQEAIQICSEELAMPVKNIFLKVRRKQKGAAQYEKLANLQHFFSVHEGKAQYLVNLADYMDTGLFLDHRLVRQFIADHVQGLHFLNLFAYTGTASVSAALGGAASTTTVDLSTVYLNWAQRNFALNGLAQQKNHFIQADCLQWIMDEKKRFDLIYLNPPTFSNSKRMQDTLDIQRDHVALIQKTIRLLTPNGIILFATNKHQFKMDNHSLGGFKLQEISRTTLPKDFARSSAQHHCWLVSLKSNERILK